jgi:SAM-dependent methyltransferase
MPLEEDLGKAYRSYYTHHEVPESLYSVPRRVYHRIKRGYLCGRYGYNRGSTSRWTRILGLVIYLNPIRRANFDASVFYLQAKPNGQLLEIGCGSGETLKLMQDFGWLVEGVDFDPAAIEVAKKTGLNVRYGTLLEQEYPASSLDAVVMSHVIEHVPDPVGLLRECHRLLKPGGKLVVITPNAASWGHRLYGADWRGLEPPRHLHIFTCSSLATVSARAGFVGAQCRTTVRANGVLLASRTLRRNGKLDRARPLSTADRLWAEATGLAQWIGSLVDREAGEEIVLTSVKSCP